MSQVSVITSGGISQMVTQYAIECPFCHSKVTPNYLCIDGYNIYASCPNAMCKKYFILSQDSGNRFVIVEPNACPKKKEFSDIINSISSQFVSIYNQAYFAEQINLDQICGVGYRKSLEFLIKDYLISKETEKQVKENIRKKFLNNCIQDHVQNDNIKNVAKRAVWLGNDETHYVRVWANKDVKNLKQLIDLTVRWIENEVETERVLQEMT